LLLKFNLNRDKKQFVGIVGESDACKNMVLAVAWNGNNTVAGTDSSGGMIFSNLL